MPSLIARAAIAGRDARRNARRRRRVERDLRALYLMRDKVRRGHVLCAVLTIPIFAAIWLAVFWKAQFFGGSVPASLAAATLAGTVVWFVGRAWLVIVPMILLAGVIMILTEEAPTDLGLGEIETPQSRRRAKLNRAIEKREALLRRLNQPA